MKKIICVMLAALMMVSLAGCGSKQKEEYPVQENRDPKSETTPEAKKEAAAEGPVKTFKIGHSVTEASHWHLGLVRFAELVEEKSKGQMKIEIYPNLTLGSEREMIEGMGLGSVDMGLVSTSIASGFTDSMLLMDLPFLFENLEHAHKVFDSQIGEQILSTTEEIGIHALTFFENGYRNITSTTPIQSIEDIRGLKIRTVESALYLDTLEAFGANPVPMTWGDVYTALQQGTIDGQEGCNDNTYKAKMHEVTPYVICTNQIYSGIFIGMGLELWNRLSQEEQQILTEAAREAAVYQRELAGQFEMEAREAMAADGATVLYEDDIADLEKWKEAVAPVYEEYAERAGGWDLIHQIQDMAK